MKVILVCSCSGMKEKAVQAYKILFPKEEEPTLFVGKDAIKKFASYHPGTNVANYAQAISKKNSRYSYYVEFDEKGDVTDNWNLLTGKRVA